MDKASFVVDDRCRRQAAVTLVCRAPGTLIMHQARLALRLSRGQHLFASDSNMARAAAPRRDGAEDMSSYMLLLACVTMSLV